MQSHPLYSQAEAAAALPGFRLTSFLEFVAGLGKAFIDTPAERDTAAAALMLAFDTFVAPRSPVIAKAARPWVESFVKETLERLAA